MSGRPPRRSSVKSRVSSQQQSRRCVSSRDREEVHIASEASRRDETLRSPARAMAYLPLSDSFRLAETPRERARWKRVAT